jgi:hypothetical protein
MEHLAFGIYLCVVVAAFIGGYLYSEWKDTK